MSWSTLGWEQDGSGGAEDGPGSEALGWVGVVAGGEFSGEVFGESRVKKLVIFFGIPDPEVEGLFDIVALMRFECGMISIWIFSWYYNKIWHD